MGKINTQLIHYPYLSTEKVTHRKRHFRGAKFRRFLEQYTLKPLPPHPLPGLKRLCRSNFSSVRSPSKSHATPL